ncbi:hypothetical protein PF010_g11912 [Phytophthora fragariae]|uniref:Uncharacterized protein n=1 Tax=Phytophthora fragariae TaxID=53985 RepID=A0A6A4DCJ2_9STRA|nr:hypothetical protein PF010_g11912 [Phytophthora fragariae]KAE9303080.1 hypothetical protein PF001_g13708 [Phytophthora fragariae]
MPAYLAFFSAVVLGLLLGRRLGEPRALRVVARLLLECYGQVDHRHRLCGVVVQLEVGP